MRGRLTSILIQNFKAVADSKQIKLNPLTVFIGNNGSGKSSVIEALQTLQRMVTVGLDGAMQAFKGMEHVRHKAVVSKAARREGSQESVSFHSMRFVLRGTTTSDVGASASAMRFRSETRLNATRDSDRYFVEVDDVQRSAKAIGKPKKFITSRKRIDAGELTKQLGQFISRWQLLSLDPARMGEPVSTRRTSATFLLDPSGANLADYLWHLVNDYAERGTAAWNGIVEALQFVLPYAGDIQPTMTTELERRSSLILQERFGKDAKRGFDVPAWMLSTGTTRVLALLAVFRHPEPPPLICIEEIENGLDPRTLQLVVNEIRSLIESKRSQVILTTHSPYLLDLLPLSSIVMTQRTEKGVTFTRPADSKEIQAWAGDFAPGQLYLMGRLDAKEGK
jgi:predicted ATPase